jgi:hypothetical protein
LSSWYVCPTVTPYPESPPTLTQETKACIMFGYSIFALVLQRRPRPRKPCWMSGFIICDVVLAMALLVVVNMLARAGLPEHCNGITRHDCLCHPSYILACSSI